MLTAGPRWRRNQQNVSSKTTSKQTGRLDSVRLTRALLQYRNTPIRATGMSSAELLIRRQLRDFLPGTSLAPPLRTFSDLRRTWRDVAEWREKALCRRATADHERLSTRTANLPPLKVGQTVLVQNQTGNHPLQWDRRGVVMEVLPFRQYKVMLDGSRQLTLRERKFLRAFTPVSPAPLPASRSTPPPQSAASPAPPTPQRRTDPTPQHSTAPEHSSNPQPSSQTTIQSLPRRSTRLARTATSRSGTT